MKRFLPVLAAFVSLSILLAIQSCGEEHKDHDSKESPYHLAMKENKSLATIYQNAARKMDPWDPAKIEETLKKLAENADKIEKMDKPDTVTAANKAQYDAFLKAFKMDIKSLRGHLKSSKTVEEFRKKTETINLGANCASCHKVFQKKDGH